jgi:hypothetical protein
MIGLLIHTRFVGRFGNNNSRELQIPGPVGSHANIVDLLSRNKLFRRTQTGGLNGAWRECDAFIGAIARPRPDLSAVELCLVFR